ncbi:MAG: TolC family protein [Bacteroidales bacterium]|nr:TolC family protein [Bacteroidales bacterium]
MTLNIKYRPAALLTFAVMLAALLPSPARSAAQPDSLATYMEAAARSNPQLRAQFLTYQAALQRVPQAGAFDDPQIDFGFFVKPMTDYTGKRVLDIKVMQMFPWFGTRKAARSEATEMARMDYEAFRRQRDQLFLDVKTAWINIARLNETRKSVVENIRLLRVLQQLATARFGTAGVSGSSGSASVSTMSGSGASVSASASASTGGAMGAMAGMGAPASSAASASTSAASSSTMGAMSGGAMTGGSGSSASLSSVLRIQLELNELENQCRDLESQIATATAAFNTLLNRPTASALCLPDTLLRTPFAADSLTAALGELGTRSPMLRMLSADAEAARAKLKMQKKMSLPMWGVGLQYSLKTSRDMGSDMTMSGTDMASMNGMDMVMPMLTVTLPIFRGKYKAEQRETQLRIEAAEAQCLEMRNNLELAYVTARQQLADADRDVQLNEAQASLAATACDLAVQEMVTERAALDDVLQAYRQLLDYRLRRATSIADYNLAVAKIENLLSSDF